MDIRQYMADLPEMDRFLTVDELNADFERIAREFPEIARRERVGSSKLGDPIHMLAVGSGARNILLFACPHPNEPIGAMLIHHLARLLCDDAGLRDGQGFTWNLISCVDPDGTRLNEGWFDGPFTVSTYARKFYRPAGHQQVEWTFPNFHKTNYFDRSLPESQMLMRVIDRLKPTLMGSLHNAGFGGVYYYLSRDEPALYPTFYELPKWEKLPLRLGEPEVPYAVQYAPAIFKMTSAAEAYDYMEANGADMSEYSHGGSSAEYADAHGTLTLVVEMAYYDDDRVNDQTVTDTNRRAAILAGLDLSDESYAFMDAHFAAVREDLRTGSAFETAVGWFMKAVRESRDAQRHWAETDPATDRPATVAELFSSNQEIRFYRLLTMGMLVRMLEGEVAVGNGTPKIRMRLKEATTTFETWASDLEADLNMRVVPIRKLVAVQLGAVLAAADHLARETGSRNA
ncbi:MAG: peptidase [Chloroflexota bacterium]|nr:peptidase [Chloroflexota bacterium]